MFSVTSDYRLGIVYDSGLSGILEDVRNSADGFLVLSFFLDDSVDVKQLTEDLSIFKDKDVKIVRSLLQSNNHAKLICAAYRAGLMTSEYQWVIALWTWGFIEESLRDHCSDSEIESMISGYFFQVFQVFNFFPFNNSANGHPK